MADTGGFFGNLMARLLPGGNQPSTGAGFLGTNIPTLPQVWSRLTGGNVPDQGLGRAFHQQYGDFTDGIERHNAAIWGEPQALMQSANEIDPSAHPSQMRPSGHTVSPIAPSAILPGQGWHDSQGYDTGWRTGAGGTGLGGGWSTVDSGAEMAALNQLLSNAGSTLGDATRFRMQGEFGTDILRPDGTTRQRGGDSRLIERSGSNSPTTAAEFVRRNPDRWAQMKRDMRKGAGRG